jgi:hypothetical protein
VPVSRTRAPRIAAQGALRLDQHHHGVCQGRNCLGTLADVVARERRCGSAELVYPQARLPARPVRIGDLLGEDIPPAIPAGPIRP